MTLAGLHDQPPTGSTIFKILADDWLCTSVDPVTDIHIWGSWLNNHLPFGNNPGAVTFKLSIHEDVPAGVDVPWSHPGLEVWQTVMPASAVRFYAPSQEYFYDPNIDQIIGTDTRGLAVQLHEPCESLYPTGNSDSAENLLA